MNPVNSVLDISLSIFKNMVITPNNLSNADDNDLSDSLVGRTMRHNSHSKDSSSKDPPSQIKSPSSGSSVITLPNTLLSAFLKKTQSSVNTEYLRRSGKRRASSEPTGTDDPWGWFEDFENSPSNIQFDRQGNSSSHFLQQPLQRSLSLPGPVTQPPFYILESSLETQQLWYVTAGQRPKQPEKERKYFEQLWADNFLQSSVLYTVAVPEQGNSNTAMSSSSKPKVMSGSDLIAVGGPVDTSRGPTDRIPPSEFDGEVLFRGKGSFSNSVSKTFTDNAMTTITLQVSCSYTSK